MTALTWLWYAIPLWAGLVLMPVALVSGWLLRAALS